MERLRSLRLRPSVRPFVLMVAMLASLALLPAGAAATAKTDLPVPAEVKRADIALEHLDRRTDGLAARRDRLARRIAATERRLDRLRGQGATRRTIRRLERRLEVLRTDRATTLAEKGRVRTAERVLITGLSLPARQRLAADVLLQGEAPDTGGFDDLLAPYAGATIEASTAERTTDASPRAALAASWALTQLGAPYRWAGRSPETGFDCSGLVYWSFQQVGVQVPHQSAELYALGERVPLDALQPGDVLSFRGQGHVGFYLGAGRYAHSTESGDVVSVSPVAARGDVDGAVRIR